MNGIHDMGGMDGFGDVHRDRDEPVFHDEWERRVFAIASTLLRRGLANIDEFRHAIERIPPAEYLRSSYYERWLGAIENLLLEKGVVSPEAFTERGVSLIRSAPPVPFESADSARRTRARFKSGDRIIVDPRSPLGHTRCPRYVRGRHGVIARDWGVYVYPDSNAHHGGDYRQHVYSVAFTARELWGGSAPARETVSIDLWESYLDPASPTGKAKSQKSSHRAAPTRRKR